METDIEKDNKSFVNERGGGRRAFKIASCERPITRKNALFLSTLDAKFKAAKDAGRKRLSGPHLKTQVVSDSLKALSRVKDVATPAARRLPATYESWAYELLDK
ncbi:jg25382 [Pararge aegeria aegeria]|uniref:Jg25382 protein n=1 Tax=Pararge aegeria aegeria TaxID=348720 RepID=A0A8S4S3T0_9NEOP|nr:jg25382 [Pararge aegeria aegeria]